MTTKTSNNNNILLVDAYITSEQKCLFHWFIAQVIPCTPDMRAEKFQAGSNEGIEAVAPRREVPWERVNIIMPD